MSQSINRPHKLHSQTKQVVYNVYAYFKFHKSLPKTKELKNLTQLVSEVTGVSTNTVTSIIRSGRRIKDRIGVAYFKSDDEIKSNTRNNMLNAYESSKVGIIRRKIIEYYYKEKEVPSFTKLCALFRNERIIKCSTQNLRILLRKIGYLLTKDNTTSPLFERKDIILERFQYIERVRFFRASGRNIFYLIEAHQLFQEVLTEQKDVPDLVAIHAHGNTGFLDGSSLMLKFKEKTNCTRDAQYEFFENYKWLKDEFITNIPPFSVLILNCPQSQICSKKFDKEPSSNATMSEMRDWLFRHKVHFEDTYTKTGLYDIIRKHCSTDTYNFYKLNHYVHTTIDLPINHFDLNPLMIASEIFGIDDIDLISNKILLTSYPLKEWKKCFNQVHSNEDKYFAYDKKILAAEHNLTFPVEIEEKIPAHTLSRSQVHSNEDKYFAYDKKNLAAEHNLTFPVEIEEEIPAHSLSRSHYANGKEFLATEHPPTSTVRHPPFTVKMKKIVKEEGCSNKEQLKFSVSRTAAPTVMIKTEDDVVNSTTHIDDDSDDMDY